MKIVLVLAIALALGCSDTTEEANNVANNGGNNGGNNGTTTGSNNGSTNGSNNGSTNGSNNGATNGSNNGSTNGSNNGVANSLSEKYPGDEGLSDDPAVLFFDDFEGGWGKWDWPNANTDYLTLESDGAMAHAGGNYLRSTVTEADLQNDQYISSSTRATFPEKTDTLYVRFYARFVGVAPNPHHWVRFAAGAEGYDSSGLANTRPPGDRGFWFDFDINNKDVFNFYVYWHEMRSGRCNDGSTTPGCEGDQGSDYFYGNTFRPPGQSAFNRDEWVCIELMGKANTAGSYGGELAFWVDDNLKEHYRSGNPSGTWLRDSFHTDGCEFSACTAPTPFEGFNFRSADDVKFQQMFLDAYYQYDTFQRKRDAMRDMGLEPSNTQTILYDDVVAATERIGCRVE